MALIVLLTIVLILCIAGVRALITVMKYAPAGWENKNEFHFKKEKFTDVKSAGKIGIKMNETK